MIDINDYKILFKIKDKKIVKIWMFVLLIIIIGMIYINNRFKYYNYYSNKGEYKNNYLDLYVLIDDLDKITENNEVYIKNKKFAYTIQEISKDNIYLNKNYYKIVKIFIKSEKLIENEVIDLKIITEQSSLIEYVFKTVWR